MREFIKNRVTFFNITLLVAAIALLSACSGSGPSGQEAANGGETGTQINESDNLVAPVTTATPPGYTYEADEIVVTLACAGNCAETYYTVNTGGSQGTPDILYTGPITLTTTTNCVTLQFYSVSSTGIAENVKTEIYWLYPPSTGGSAQWITQFGTAGYDEGHGIAVDIFGNSYVTGSTGGDIAGTGNAGLYDVFVAKYDASANQVWITQFGTTSSDRGSGIALDASGNSYVTGDFAGGAFVAKYDTNGNQMWMKQLGTEDWGVSFGIDVDSSGNSYTAGFIKVPSNVTGVYLQDDTFIVKHDTDGNQVWITQFARDEGGSAVDLAVDSSGNIYTTGENSSGALITKFDAGGNQVWRTQLGVATSGLGSGIDVDSFGNSYVTGSSDFDVFIEKYDTNGNRLWVTQFGTLASDFGGGIAVDSLGNSYVSGITDGNLAGTGNAGSTDIFVAKYGTDGARLWIKQFGTENQDGGYGAHGIAVDSLGNSYVTASLNGDIAGTISAGGADVFIAKNFPSPQPSDATYTVGGTMSGLVGGETVALQNNGGDDLAITADGVFNFVTELADNATYDVTVSTQPGRFCNIANGAGRITGANITNISVTCFDFFADVAAIAGGIEYTVAVKNDGTTWAWGNNGYGQLGATTTEVCSPSVSPCSTTPIQVSGLTDVVGIAAGGAHVLAFETGGAVWAWGYNNSGQLGNGTTTNSSAPIQVSGLTGVTVISAGGGHNLALKTDGTIWAWGNNEYGQLGVETTETCFYNSIYSYSCSKTPLQITGITGVVAIVGGGKHTVALKADGTVLTWGFNEYGQLGNGTTTDSATPLQVSGLTDVVAIAAGYWHSIALKTDGTVWAWGDNWYGRLGVQTTEICSGWDCATTPLQVGGLTNVTTIAAGGAYGYSAHNIALKTDGSVWAWGNNESGQLGNGTTTDSATPLQVSGLTGVTAFAGGGWHTVAVKTDGTAWAWGGNRYGQLGDGTRTNSPTPVQVLVAAP